MDFNQIFLNDNNHQVLFVDGPKMHPTNPRWRMAAILKKNEKIAISLQLFRRFRKTNWHSDASRPSASHHPLKFPEFENSRCGRPPCN